MHTQLSSVARFNRLRLMKNRSALMIILMLQFGASELSAEPSTTVYKTVNPDGSISYSDSPGANSQSIDVPHITTIPALETSKTKHAQTSTKSFAYSNLSITQPANHSAFHSPTGSVNVNLNISPALQEGHRIRLKLDGRETHTSTSSNILISDVYRGTHQLEAQILAEDDEILMNAFSTFTVHRPISKK